MRGLRESSELRKTRLLLVLVLGLAGRAPANQTSQAPLKKNCGDGIVLKVSSGAASQGGLVLAEVLGAKDKQEISAELDAKAVPMWREAANSFTLHALIGVDLEKPPGTYDWKVSWSSANGQSVT